MKTRPFWEDTYADPEQDTFGEPSSEVIDLASRLAPGARVLDAGCGDGRHALYLARRGFAVDAFDSSDRAITKLKKRAEAEGLCVSAWVEDLRQIVVADPYDLIICHGVLHLLNRRDWGRVVGRLQTGTRAGGWNVLVVFTDRLAPPADLAPFMHGLFREGELFGLYAEWDLERCEAYTLDDEHPGGIRHRHPINKLVARRRA